MRNGSVLERDCLVTIGAVRIYADIIYVLDERKLARHSLAQHGMAWQGIAYEIHRAGLGAH